MMPHFHHVSLLTRHGKPNTHFYTEILGLRFVKNTVNQDNNRMFHLYYGDYKGSPHSVVTFFVVPKLGHRYDNDHSLQTVGLNLPKGSLNYWENRLESFNIPFEKKGKTLYFKDEDNVDLSLTETDLPMISDDLKTLHTDIPQEDQILGLRSTEFHVPDVEKTTEFFEKFLGWKEKDGHIQLSETEMIEILPTDAKEKSHMGRGSMDHVAFAVKDDEALDELYKKAQDQGWNIEKIVSRGYFKSLYIREPGGNRVEFATMAPGFTIDEPLETLGESFALPPFLEPKRKEIEANLYVEE